MSKNYDELMKLISGVEFTGSLEEMAQWFQEKAGQETELKVRVSSDEDTINISYKLDREQGSFINLAVAAGLPVALFDKAEEEYRKQLEEHGTGYKYILTGSGNSGALVQYAAIVCGNFLETDQEITYNGTGMGNMLKFRGNEFLGYKTGLLFYMDELLNKELQKRKMSIIEKLEFAFIDRGIIFYDEDGQYSSIAGKYRLKNGIEVDADKLKPEIAGIIQEVLELEREKAEELVEKNFDPGIIELKMRLIERYRVYKKWAEKKIDHYLLSENITAQLNRQSGQVFLIDKAKRDQDKLLQELINIPANMEKEQLGQLTGQDIGLFAPFVLLEKDGNGPEALNKSGKKPEIGQITDKLSHDYLKAVIKKIVKELKTLDSSVLKELFIDCQRGNWSELLLLARDRLRYSMKQRGIITEEEPGYSSKTLRKSPELFEGLKEYYPLDRIIIGQLDNMSFFDQLRLINWKVSADGIFLILGSETEEDNIFEYHSETNPLDNKLEEIKLELNEPSNNRIYGSEKMPSNYRAEYDKNYHYREEDAYNFTSNHGVGAMITSSYKDPAKKIKIDGRDISGEYEEKDRESVDIGERTVTLRDRYFGENIILRNMKKSMGKITGDLLYIYGPGKKDQLLVEGFVSGDYGIELKEKAKEVSDEKEPIRFTDYKIEIDPFEIIILEEFELVKSLNEHSRVRLRGIIREEKAAEYRRYCKGKDPSLVIKYLFNDQEKYLFKGIIYYSDIHNSRQNASIEIEAVSYSVLLEREMRYRIYQNQGSSYQDIFNILKRANPDFNFTDDGTVNDKPIITEDYPVVLQYRETDWDFILRIASYLDKAVFVNDIRDRTEKIDILVGCHPAPAVEMKNVSGEAVKETGPKNIKYNYLKVMRFVHKCEEDLFEVGKKVRHRFKLWGEGDMESIILKNRIYLEKGILYSDYILAREEDINILNRERKIPIEGRSFRAEVVEVNREHRAKVRFLDLEDDFEEGKARYFPIDRYYRESYFAPEKGDIVDIYFKSKNERYAALKGSSTEGRDDIKNPPEEKVLARTPGGYTIVMSNDSIEVRGKDGKNVARVKGDRITYRLKKDGADSEITIDSKMIRLRNKNSEMVIDDTKTELNSNGTKVRLSDKGIEFM